MLERLTEMGQTRLAGALRRAKVVNVNGDSITLGFDESDDPHRVQCSGALAGRIDSVFSELTGRTVRCRYVSTGSAGESAPAAGRQISTEDKKQINGDPDVRKVLEAFGGDLIDMRIEEPTPAPAETDEPEEE